MALRSRLSRITLDPRHHGRLWPPRPGPPRRTRPRRASATAPTTRPAARTPTSTTTARPAPARAARSADPRWNAGSASPTSSAAPRAAASRRTARRSPIAGALVATALIVTGETVPVGDWRFWLMALLVLAGELIPIDVPRRDGVDRVAISTAFAFAILLLFGLLPAVVAYAAASAIADVRARLSAAEGRLQRGASTRSSLAAAALVLAAARPRAADRRRSAALLAPVLAGAAAFFVVNHVLVGVGVALFVGEPPARYLFGDLPFQVLTVGLRARALAGRRRVGRGEHGARAARAAAGAGRLRRRAPGRARHPPRLPRRADRPAEPPAAAPAPRARARARPRTRASRSPCCWSTSTTSRPSTTRSATPTATGCSATSPARMRGALGRDDLLARLGGDEFAVLPDGAVRRRARARDGRAARGGARAAVRARRDPARRPRERRARAATRTTARPRTTCCAAPTSRSTCAKAAQRPVEVYSAGKDHYTVDRLMLAAPAAPRARDGGAGARVPAEVPARAAAPPSASRRWPAGSTRRSGASARTASSRWPSRRA